MNSKFRNKNNTFTAYALFCGSVERKGEPYSGNYLLLYVEHSTYHVKGSILDNKVWFTFQSLTKARKQFKTIKI